ncbi:MAG TPA: 23S rRNA (pseudouridine(1915)-N(3))-methyltransferase RlmH [Pusillimonas sp.]|jgi:23S rRNA (pseudouridine1915-N3)-methyltransferase|nr:23S rRNA (pseudouridine(1915)-N(3))-methyltransferase RlmH [Pusillimonas sp.]HBT33726.1 23S rRNA (pseudouridine(1915)-N(3))-methyltransferase RlmH [Pusillimonas sp.]HCN70729.1 23S rRNA (pseudouridine(1915)-N(3))-methyltransferase RlmH [Pusillimonas sp.]HCP77537.1 23S rRNA (pseudouridine(1915)-N(3))-methyltransferase RlmH [Pusillimonas sp.]|tara:strand:+ start:126970 stop:127440 length:471 start_codon:yes stop_codon:yes gene_type:complete
MKLWVIAVGTRMPQWVSDAWHDYAKRLPPDCSLELKEIKPEPRTSGKSPAQLMQAEASRITTALPTNALYIALDETGRDFTTARLAVELEKWRGSGRDVVFLIGGPDGLDPSLKQRCDSLMRLSSLTLPHPMVRVVLAEQLYRAWAINTNHPYHRA